MLQKRFIPSNISDRAQIGKSSRKFHYICEGLERFSIQHILNFFKCVLFDLESVRFEMASVLFGVESVRCGLEDVLFDVESVLIKVKIE